MSGGTFDYSPYVVEDICDTIEAAIDDGEYSLDVTAKLKEGLNVFRTAYIYMYEIDYLLSGDVTEERFLERLNDNLDE